MMTRADITSYLLCLTSGLRGPSCGQVLRFLAPDDETRSRCGGSADHSSLSMLPLCTWACDDSHSRPAAEQATAKWGGHIGLFLSYGVSLPGEYVNVCFASSKSWIFGSTTSRQS
jgi:hypothetical protein